MRVRLAIAVLLALLALVAGWLLLRGAGEDGGAEAVPHAETSTEPEELADARAAKGAPSLVGTSDAESSSAAAGTIGDVVVEVLGREHVHLPGFPLLLLDENGDVLDRLLTDAEGRGVFRDVAYDGSRRIVGFRRGFRPHEESDMLLSEHVPVTGPHVVLQTNLGLPCEVHAVDAESGRRFEGIAWGLLPRQAAIDDLDPVRLAGRRWIPVAPGVDLGLRLVVDAPPGYVAWANDEPYVGISRYATSIRYVYPLHREADVVIDVLEHDGSPARDPCVVGWSLAGREDEALFGDHGGERLALNRLRLRGVPYVPDALLRVRVGLESLEDERTVEAVARLTGRTRLVARLPHPDGYEPPTEPIPMPGESMIGLGGSADAHPPLPPKGRIDLVATRRSGQPASGARVSFGYGEEGYALRGFQETLDAQGHRQQDVPEGTWRVALYEPGLVQTTETVEVRAGETTIVRLREGRGGTVRLRVVDPGGRPLPFARVHIDDWMWRDLEDGLQRLDPYVDENGTRTLEHVSPGDIEVTAWYAGGRGSAEVTVREGGRISVTVVVEPGE